MVFPDVCFQIKTNLEGDQEHQTPDRRAKCHGQSAAEQNGQVKENDSSIRPLHELGDGSIAVFAMAQVVPEKRKHVAGGETEKCPAQKACVMLP